MAQCILYQVIAPLALYKIKNTCTLSCFNEGIDKVCFHIFGPEQRDKWIKLEARQFTDGLVISPEMIL